MLKEQSYRASIGAIIIDDSFNFLLVKLNGETRDRWDFVKGGMNEGEDEIQTLNREIKEELGSNIKFDLIEKSSWYFVYNWSLDLQRKKGFRGQIRQNYWILYKEGNIDLDRQELSEYKWVGENYIQEELKKGGFPDIEIKRFMEDFIHIKQSLISKNK